MSEAVTGGETAPPVGNDEARRAGEILRAKGAHRMTGFGSVGLRVNNPAHSKKGVW